MDIIKTVNDLLARAALTDGSESEELSAKAYALMETYGLTFDELKSMDINSNKERVDDTEFAPGPKPLPSFGSETAFNAMPDPHLGEPSFLRNAIILILLLAAFVFWMNADFKSETPPDDLKDAKHNINSRTTYKEAVRTTPDAQPKEVVESPVVSKQSPLRPISDCTRDDVTEAFLTPKSKWSLVDLSDVLPNVHRSWLSGSLGDDYLDDPGLRYSEWSGPPNSHSYLIAFENSINWCGSGGCHAEILRCNQIECSSIWSGRNGAIRLTGSENLGFPDFVYRSLYLFRYERGEYRRVCNPKVITQSN